MKRLKKLVSGGIQNKIFNLILATVILMTVAFSAVSAYRANMLANAAEEEETEEENEEENEPLS